MIKIAINGFGRMGRLAFREAWDRNDLEIVHINELKGDAVCAAHLLEFDSVHGRWDRDIKSANGEITIGDKKLTVTHEEHPKDVDWSSYGVDIVLECSGAYREVKDLQSYLDNGVKKVIVACPVKDDSVLNIVYGINDNLYEADKNHIITAASCTTNCLAPVVDVIQRNLGIKHGVITTIHDITNTQTIIDAPHKDLRRARACGQSLIPTSTGSATAITMIYPELKDKLNGVAVRVPLLNASITDCVFEVERETTVEELTALFQSAEDTYLEGILGFETRPLVSVDFKDEKRSTVIDGPSLMVNDKTQIKILAWYDNEIGYVNRMVDLTKKVADEL